MFRKCLTTYCHNVLYFNFLLVLFFGCRENKAQEENQELEFRVDTALLAPCYSDSLLKFTFCPPKGWNPLPDSTLKQVKTRLETNIQPTHNIQFRLIQLFLDPTNGNSCSLSQVSGVVGTLVDLIEIYEESLQEKFPEAQISTAKFKIEKINVVQFLILTNEKVIFKLIFASPTKAICQLDFAVARAVYPNVVRSVESSVGSLRPMF